MRHARTEELDRLEPLLKRLRQFAALKERSRGVFYVKGRAFLHFHADPAALFADVRQGEGFERLKVAEGQDVEDLLLRVQQGLSA